MAEEVIESIARGTSTELIEQLSDQGFLFDDAKRNDWLWSQGIDDATIMPTYAAVVASIEARAHFLGQIEPSDDLGTAI